MTTFEIIMIVIMTIICCYYINRKILKSFGEDCEWRTVFANLAMSILIPISIIYWMLFISYKLPAFPEKPPKWL